MMPEEPEVVHLHRYAVGERYSKTRTTAWPEHVEYNWRQGGHELRAFLANPSRAEVAAFGRGPAQFAVAVHGPVIFFLYQFGSTDPKQAHAPIPWSDAPYSIHLLDRRNNPEIAELPQDQRDQDRGLPDIEGLTPESRVWLHIVLVDAHTDVVLALRSLTLPAEVTSALHQAIVDQAAAPWPGAAAYDRALNAVYARYPSSHLLLQTAIARGKGGE